MTIMTDHTACDMCGHCIDCGDCRSIGCGTEMRQRPTTSIAQLLPIETAPKDGTYIILFGPSGYSTTPLRCEVCRYDKEYRPLQPWVTYSNDSFLDSGEPPTHWLPLPEGR